MKVSQVFLIGLCLLVGCGGGGGSSNPVSQAPTKTPITVYPANIFGTTDFIAGDSGTAHWIIPEHSDPNNSYLDEVFICTQTSSEALSRTKLTDPAFPSFTAMGGVFLAGTPGESIAAWVSSAEYGSRPLLFSSQEIGGSWSSFASVLLTGSSVDRAQNIIVLKDEAAHVYHLVWTVATNWSVWTSTQSVGTSTWSTPTRLFPLGNLSIVTAQMNPAGHGVMVLSGNINGGSSSTWASYRSPGGTWSAPVDLGVLNYSSWHLAINADNSAMLLTHNQEPPTFNSRVFWQRFTPAGGWSTRTELTTGTNSISFLKPLAVPGGRFVLLSRQANVCAYDYQPSTGWSAPSLVATTPFTYYGMDWLTASATSAGDVLLAWQQGTPNPEAWVCYRPAGSVWQVPYLAGPIGDKGSSSIIGVYKPLGTPIVTGTLWNPNDPTIQNKLWVTRY